jgi:CRISPR-associated protein Cas2
MRGLSDYAVVYDITSDKERARVDKTLKNFGFRIQKSVFECRLTKKSREELIGKLIKLELKTGFVKLYRLEFSSKNSVVGVPPQTAMDDKNAFIV